MTTEQPTSTTSGTDLTTLARAGYEAFNRRDLAVLPAIYTDDVQLVDTAAGQRRTGVAGIEEFFGLWTSAFENARVEITNVRQLGDTAVCEFRGTGTHTGTFRTPAGDVPATGRSVDVQFCDVMTIRDGRIAEIHTYYDSATFARQLGLM